MLNVNIKILSVSQKVPVAFRMKGSTEMLFWNISYKLYIDEDNNKMLKKWTKQRGPTNV